MGGRLVSKLHYYMLNWIRSFHFGAYIFHLGVYIQFSFGVYIFHLSISIIIKIKYTYFIQVYTVLI